MTYYANSTFKSFYIVVIIVFLPRVVGLDSLHQSDLNTMPTYPGRVLTERFKLVCFVNKDLFDKEKISCV